MMAAPTASRPSFARTVVAVAALAAAFPAAATNEESGAWSAREIMEETVRRHEHFPYTFEKQSMVLIDRAGNRDVRKLRRFSRLEPDGTLNYLLVLDQPREVRGVALLATRNPDGTIDNRVFLPAYGTEMKSGVGESQSTPFLGTDFTIQDLTPEITDDYRYERKADVRIGDIPHFLIVARPKDPQVERATGYSERRMFIRQDNFFVVRTDFFDRRGRLFKRRTRHDLQLVDGAMWRANMTLMEDIRESHKSLIKINQRVFSHDYVPPETFTTEWILDNANLSTAADTAEPETPESPATQE